MTPHELPLRCPFCHQVSVTDYIHNDYMDAECLNPKCKRIFSRRDEARDLFHMLWGKSVDSGHYYKEVWNRLSFLLKF
jgi:hypothetical protein